MGSPRKPAARRKGAGGGAKATAKTEASKKRPRSSSSPSTKKKRATVTASANTTSSSNNKKAPTTAAAAKTAIHSSEPPLRALIIDNGGDTLKYGWSSSNSSSNTEASREPPARRPRYLPNVTARLQQQWTVLVGDELSQIQNPNQLQGVTRSTERGMINNLGNQVQVWKRLLDLLNIEINTHTDTAQAFGWSAASNSGKAKKKKKTAKRSKETNNGGDDDDKNAAPDATTHGNNTTKIAAGQCAVLLLLPPFCPRVLLDQIMAVWMDDFGFGHVGFSVSAVCAAHSCEQVDYRTTCLVDLGWSATHVVPVYQHKVLVPPPPPVPKSETARDNKKVAPVTPATAIRRLPLAGRHLINMWKYYTSYRQWNLMDQEWIMRQVLHLTGYVSMQFEADMRVAQSKSAGRRPYDREFVLPNAQNNFQGIVQLPPYLQRERAAAAAAAQGDDNHDEQDSEEDDESVKEEDMIAQEENDDNDSDGDNDEEEETMEQAKQRLLKQRQEDERRRQELEAQQQVLNVSVERFSVPEALFRPGDAGLPLDWASLPVAIVQSVEACPKEFQPALYRSIKLVGGLSQLENLRNRLEQELRALVPCAYDVKIQVSEQPMEEAWIGAHKLVARSPYSKWSVSREEWEASPKHSAWKHLLQLNGGVV